MAYPADFVPGYDYVAFAAGQGDNSFPGNALAADLADIQTSIAEINDFLQVPFRSDAVLKAGSTLDTVALAAATDAAAASAAAALLSEGNAFTSKGDANTSALAAAGSASAAATTLSGAALKANNLSDLANVATARTNLGLGTAATTASTAYATAAQGTLAGTALQVLPSGSSIQTVNTQTGVMATGTTTVPWDDTIPQITEGTEFMTRAITPTNASNILIIDVVANCNVSAVNYIIGALHQDAAANALAAVAVYQEGASRAMNMRFTHRMVAGTTSATTFRFRAGPGGAATLTFNGEVGARKLGGVYASSITITEVKA